MRLARKTLLFLSSDHFQAHSWHKGRLSEAHTFASDTEGHKQFSEFLQQHREPTYLLVDVIEEDFRREFVPHLSGKNRRELIQRKFDQHYRNTLFRQATVLHRKTDGRRDDEMLFSALTNPQHISPWLDILETLGIPLTGIYSLPGISTQLIKDIDSEHILLLSWEKHAGLRQTYFNQKHLHFSRLTPISGNSSFGESITAETPRTQHYLNSLSLPPHGETLDVFVICHANDRPSLEAALHSTPELRYHYLDIAALGIYNLSRTPYPDSDATTLFLRLLAQKPSSSHYANSTHTHYHLLWQLRSILFGLAAIITLASAAWSGTAFLQGRDYASETAPLLAQAAQLASQSEEIKSRFPVTTTPANDMKTAVILMRNFEKYFPSPEEILRDLSSVLDMFDRIRPGRIAWQTSGADAAPSAYPAQVIILDGELLDFGSDYRSALEYLERFQQALAQHGYTVTAQKSPLDISPKGSISNDQQSSPEKWAQFTLKLVWRKIE